MGRKDYYHDKNSPMANSIVAAASAVIIDQSGRILLHKRKDNNMWSLLGGAMETGESISQTIIREVKEESGYDVKINKLIGIYTDPQHVIEYSDGEIRQQFSICFNCEVVAGNLTISDESKDVQFFNIDELNKLNIHEAQWVRIKDYLDNKEYPFIK
ncbi:NUDIX hydrolase [Hathewaya limosa]|uniref:ADP-ribose pyrophosphatase YjhB (NUDIX family) n=1 Tax=Hathewaya limosa TaxID=1536 RepID=A0ABU0JU58_HATLI|nr:NUDIX domain-containing protein [Hathewaya limosa]MDQ0479935.1 ADP-ribose pyrophosphatase YjhB (NUDIX family) [Hathewaya limosa]